MLRFYFSWFFVDILKCVTCFWNFLTRSRKQSDTASETINTFSKWLDTATIPSFWQAKTFLTKQIPDLIEKLFSESFLKQVCPSFLKQVCDSFSRFSVTSARIISERLYLPRVAELIRLILCTHRFYTISRSLFLYLTHAHSEVIPHQYKSY